MPKESQYQESSQAVQKHLDMVQSLILRMASNSASCKTWCITVVSAILVFVSDKSKPEFVLIAVVPTILFLILDTYYLSLEKIFRDQYNSFLKKLHEDKVTSADLYALTPDGKAIKKFFPSLLSFSIWPFYLILFIIIMIVKIIVI